jgi:hypothetical protein
MPIIDQNAYSRYYHSCEDDAVQGTRIDPVEVVRTGDPEYGYADDRAKYLGCLDGIAGTPLAGSDIHPK